MRRPDFEGKSPISWPWLGGFCSLWALLDHKDFEAGVLTGRNEWDFSLRLEFVWLNF